MFSFIECFELISLGGNIGRLKQGVHFVYCVKSIQVGVDGRVKLQYRPGI
jgi:hypothetical protein